MASLDNIEGDAIEGVILFALIAFVVIFVGLYKSLGDPLKALQEAGRKLLSLFQNALHTPLKENFAGPAGVAQVDTGAAGWSADDEAHYQDELLAAAQSGQLTVAEYEKFAGGN